MSRDQEVVTSMQVFYDRRLQPRENATSCPVMKAVTGKGPWPIGAVAITIEVLPLTTIPYKGGKSS
jgi:hypothetical protein